MKAHLLSHFDFYIKMKNILRKITAETRDKPGNCETQAHCLIGYKLPHESFRDLVRFQKLVEFQIAEELSHVIWVRVVIYN